MVSGTALLCLLKFGVSMSPHKIKTLLSLTELTPSLKVDRGLACSNL